MNPLSTSPRDWTDDFAHENGNYLCGCVVCGERFKGHKRRKVCKVCADADDAEAKRRAEWLHAHNAPKDWVVLTESEVAQIKSEHIQLVLAHHDLRAALSDIHTRAHCLAKAGPLHTPKLDVAWQHFMELGVMATAALSKSRIGNVPKGGMGSTPTGE